MKLFSLSFLIAFFLLLPGFSQTSLKGAVLDQEDSKPLASAMVFLANTSVGTLTDENGNFSLSLPKGRFELVISKMGYEKSVIELNSMISPGKPLTIFLQKTEIELAPLQVNEVRDPHWYQNLQIFKNNFLGQTNNSTKTTLINEKSLILDDLSSPRFLKARSNETLKISNKALGYDIEYDLAVFEFNLREKSMISGGYPLFLPQLTNSKARQKEFEKNRLQVYHGSLMHFLRAFYSNTLSEEGFEVYRLQRIPNPDRPSDQEIAAMAEKIRNGQSVQIDLRSFSELAQKPKFIEVLDPNPLDISKISAKNQEGDLEIKFEDFLFIRNTKYQPLPSYFVNFKPGKQESILHFQNGSITIQENGNHFPAFDLILEGYMSWLKVADLLPLDYWPKTNE